MRILLSCFAFFLNLIYLLFKILPTSNKKITFLSRQSNKISLDMTYIKDELLNQDPSLKLIFLCKRFDNPKKHIISYGFFTLKTMYHIATSKVCITDSYSLPISVLKHKKSLKVLQIWHAMGAIKKFGYQSCGKLSGRSISLTKGLKMHRNYTKIVSGSKAMTKYFKEAFGYPESTFLNIGLPRMDYLLKNKDSLKEKIYLKYPEFKDKKVILYAPTFRTTKDKKIEELLSEIDFSKYHFILKVHPNQEIDTTCDDIYRCNEFSALDLLSICDYLITDYSAIAIEAAILDVKTYYYVFDYNDYKKNNGLNINLFKEMPGCVFDDASQLAIALNKKYPINTLKKYKDKYIDVQDGTSTELIVKQIMEWIGEQL